MGLSPSSYNYDNVSIISIDGNIGSGKSTLLERLRTHYADRGDVIFLREPVSDWETIQDANHKTMLSKFYEDKQKYAFPFQMMAYISRLSILRETIRNRTNDKPLYIITERSLYTDRHVFAKMLYNDGDIEYVNYQIYLRWFDEFAQDFPLSHIIYVDTSPEICYERIHKRAREGEELIPLEYLKNCHNYHNQFTQEINCPLLTLDGNVNIFENGSILEEWLEQIGGVLNHTTF